MESSSATLKNSKRQSLRAIRAAIYDDHEFVDSTHCRDCLKEARDKEMSKKPTVGEVLAELRRMVKEYRSSYREYLDGKVHDDDALRTIRCLRKAIQIVRSK